ncbi:MAG: zinc ribbon domain-containing protein [Burkholderiaceae bacterium]
MSYDYSSESRRLELPNPYRLQNRFLWGCAALLIGGGLSSLLGARDAMEFASAGRTAAPLAVGLVLLLAGLACAATAARRLRFFFGRGRPHSLAPDIPVGAVGGSPLADAVKDMLRQGGITYPEPQGAVEGVLYHWAPQLITAPQEVQFLAQRNMFNLAALAATLASFVFSSLVFGNEATRPWIGLLYFAFGAYFLVKPVLGQGRARLSSVSLAGLIAAAILAPVLLGLLAGKLPDMAAFSVTNQTWVMLLTALAACALATFAVLAQVDAAPQTRASVEQQRLSMNSPPASLMDELDRHLQTQWTERIPNRRYARIEPVVTAETATGSFAGELLEETQPLPLPGSAAPTLASALPAPRHRMLLLLDAYGTALVLAALVCALLFVRRFDAASPLLDNRLSLLGSAAILGFVGAFCFRESSRLWGRFDFESVLTWVEMVGNYQRSRIGTGNNFSSRMTSENDVVRTEAMTLRVWRARIESVVFGKDDNRQVTAMFSTEPQAKALAEHLLQFARGMSVFVAPTSSEDQQRIAALNQGERALVGAADAPPAALIHRELQTAAALGTAGKRFCTACGTEAGPGARFCSNCAAAL